MEDVKPLCPYCGAWNGHPDGVEMKPIGGAIAKRFRCPECDAMSPLKDNTDDALASAIRRFQPLQKPLTLEEVRSLCRDEEDRREHIFIEFRRSVSLNTYARPLNYDEHGIDAMIPEERPHLMMYDSKYNRTWRPWLTIPTAEERAAAKWEGES